MRAKNKAFFLYALGGVCALAVAVDTGNFYEGYNATGIIGIGYFYALLVETLLAVMASVRFQGHKWLNISSKILMVCLFVLTVGVSASNIVLPQLGKVAAIQRSTQIFELLREGTKSEEKGLKYLMENGQRLNSVLSIRNLRKVRSEAIKKIEKRSSPPFLIYSKIAFHVAFKLLVQTSSLLLFYVAGIMLDKENRAIEGKKPVVSCTPIVKTADIFEVFNHKKALGKIILTRKEIADKLGVNPSVVSCCMMHSKNVFKFIHEKADLGNTVKPSNNK